MPTPDFTLTTNAPAAISLPSNTPTGSSPAAVGSQPALSTDAPTGVGTPAALTTDGPSGISLPSTTPTGSAPAAVGSLPALTGDGPTAIGDLGDDYAPDETAPSPIAWSPIITNPTDANMHTASLHLIGNLALNQVFGFYKAPANCVNKGLQVFLQKAPTGTAAIIELVDEEGNALGREIEIPVGEQTAEITHETPLPLVGGAIVRGKVKQIGSTVPGAYATVTLVQQLAS